MFKKVLIKVLAMGLLLSASLVSANQLDMLGIINTSLFRLLLVYLSCHICIKTFNAKNYSNY